MVSRDFLCNKEYCFLPPFLKKYKKTEAGRLQMRAYNHFFTPAGVKKRENMFAKENRIPKITTLK